ncbi:MAG: hypothetical protein ACP5RE_02245 [Candidatus Acidifodinimicrobium sp.]
MANITLDAIEACLALILLFSLIFLLKKNKKHEEFGFLGYTVLLLAVFQVAFGIYLLSTDITLLIYGYFHWIVLLVYTTLMMIFILASYIGKYHEVSTLLFGVLSAALFVLMLVDVYLNLPFSYFYNAYNGIGFSYLLGFGRNAVSSIGVSAAFVALLILSLSTLILSFYAVFKQLRS